MDRRKFIRGTGLFGGLIAGVVAGKTVVEKIHTRETIKEVAGISDPKNAPSAFHPTLSLMTQNPDLTTKKETRQAQLYQSENIGLTVGSVYDECSNYELVEKNIVSLAAGKDNRLWIKVNDEWYRVAVDMMVSNEKA